MKTVKQIFFNLCLSILFIGGGIALGLCGFNMFLEFFIDRPLGWIDGILCFFLITIGLGLLGEAFHIMRFITLTWDERKIREKELKAERDSQGGSTNWFLWGLIAGLFWNRNDKYFV
jgi:hypothetical protein